MLAELLVRDLGVINELSLVLGNGMTVVTGETGAGKTLIVGAIDLLTGGRADASLVRPGAAEAEIQGRFVAGDEEIVVRRVIPREGRSRVYVNGHLATVAALTELGQDLVDLYGQHAHQSLLKAAVQRAALDQFGNVDTSELASVEDRLRVNEAALAEMGGDERTRAREIDLLRHQLAEIEAAAVRDPDEEQRLSAEEDLLADATEHREAAATVADLLGSEGATAEGLASAIALFRGRGPFTELANRLHGLAAELADIVSEARSLTETLEDDPAQLAYLRERRALLRELRRKYGDTLDEVLSFRDETSQRLAELESFEQRAEALEAERAQLLALRTRLRGEVLAARTKAAPRLADAVEGHLGGLAMPSARMEVVVAGEAGGDVTFQIAANTGHDPQPLTKVASGGELARVMLALRLVLSAGPATLVFDEVDAGIGGDVAKTVGSSLAGLAANHQVFVVTHLAQVAAFAHTHVAIIKSDQQGQTVSDASILDPDERVIELSRMLSGSPDSRSARDHAAELLASAARP